MIDLAHQAAGRLQIVSDVICPWCYVGRENLRGALAMLAAEGISFAVSWHPFQLNPDMPRAGLPRDAYRTAKFGSLERSRALDAQVAAAAEAVGLTMRHDLMQRTPNTLDAHRVIRFAGMLGEQQQDAVVRALFVRYFEQGGDIGDRAVLAECAAEAGIDPALIATQLAAGDGEADVLAEDAAAREGGVNGVPSFFLDGHFLFSGARPAAAMAEALRHALRILRAEHQAA